MCGIAGIIAPGRDAGSLAEAVRRMTGTMVHRGPDSDGIYADTGVSLGMRRLSIIDLTTGDQPIANETRDVWVVQNGEIYNYRELRRSLEGLGHRFTTNSDTEVIVHGWEEWGADVLSRLNGMFAFAVWDGRTRTLFVARDRMGIKPLYWASVGDAVLFGSELKTMLASGLVDRSLDTVALGQYLVFEYVPSPRSILAGVHKLEAGSTITARDGAAPVIERYWDLAFDPDRSQGEAVARDRIMDALERAAALELVSDVPIGVLLSGGIDSSAVALAVSRVSSAPKTFTVGFHDASFDESPYAREVAGALRTEHHDTILSPQEVSGLVADIAGIVDEPLADSSLIPTFLLSRFARDEVKVALGGDGGDELWAGYPTMQAHALARRYRAVPRWIREKILVPAVNRLPVSTENISLDFRLKRFVQGADLAPELQHQLWLGGYAPAGARDVLAADLRDGLADEALFDPIIRRLPAARDMEPMDRLLYLDAKLYLEGDILTKVDRASMAVSLEVRVPLLNREVVEVARTTPFEWKLRGRRTKAIMRDVVAGRLPRTVATRGKKGFNIPVAKWLRGQNRFLLDDLVKDPPAVFDAAAVRRLSDEHLAGTHDHRKLLWPLIVYRLWERRWGVAA